jgi:hypothetical protein
MDRSEELGAPVRDGVGHCLGASSVDVGAHNGGTRLAHRVGVPLADPAGGSTRRDSHLGPESVIEIMTPAPGARWRAAPGAV